MPYKNDMRVHTQRKNIFQKKNRAQADIYSVNKILRI